METAMTGQCAWIHPAKNANEFPLINIIAADPGSDSYYRPITLDQFPVSTYRFVNETIFLYGRDPAHKAPWTMNTLLPLHSIMTIYQGTQSSWFMRVTGQENKDGEGKKLHRMAEDQNADLDLDTYLLAPYGREIVLNPREKKEFIKHQINPPSKSMPTCFARAVVGLQSRCTRPYCEHLIGGSTLTESLRTKVLQVLSPSMFRFQKTDPDIIHPVAGEHVPTISQDDMTVLEGESVPRSKIQIALLGRYGNTSIPNANALETSLLARGFDAKTIHLDYPSEINLAQAAQLFRNQSILVAPQGDGLGYSTWMEPGTVVVSILPRFTRSSKVYTDRMMAFGKRFFAWDCQNESCVQPDRDLAHECIEAAQKTFERGQGISASDFEEFANMRQDFRQRSLTWKAIADCYSKDVSRRLNVEELTTLIESLAKDFVFGSSINKEQQQDEDQHSKRTLSRRGVDDDFDDQDQDQDEDENENEDEDEDEDDQTTETDPVLSNATEDERENEDDDEGDVRIEVEAAEEEEEEEEEDINLHEYDAQPAAAVDEQDDEKQDEPMNAPAPPAPSAPALKTPPKTPSYANEQDQHPRPMLSFVEFCKRGRCCGSVKPASAEMVGSSGSGESGEAKGLTPCGASMAAIVFGVRGVWGQADGTAPLQESQDVVWQVDLGRDRT
ncbi:hypothetical protein BG011_004128 [Mortierella polycephala]|uniref:Glycosyltransferase family 61 protein n=1 Tax=Mortierella polycephala TaxID=41804 RepID=A0A9P6U9W4_9FUNG|nr:hypothetical protein BG011_004128 [Mortierella polycephala]